MAEKRIPRGKHVTPPPTPGEIIRDQFMAPRKMTQVELARRLGVPIGRVNLILTGKRAVSAETALLLARVFEMEPLFWLNLQNATDLYAAERKLAKAS